MTEIDLARGYEVQSLLSEVHPVLLGGEVEMRQLLSMLVRRGRVASVIE